MPEQLKQKSLTLTEEEFRNLPERVWDLIDAYPETDPRSTRYIRHLSRPRIRWHLFLLFIAGDILLCLFAVLIARTLKFSVFGSISAAIVVSLLFCFILRRFLLTGLIRTYQHFAPDQIRNRCMYEPSCSDYMLQAIQKYGPIHGLIRGIRRLKRCNSRGGGFDPP